MKQCTRNTTSFVFKEKLFQIYLTSVEKAVFLMFKYFVLSLFLLFPSFLTDLHAIVGNRPTMTTDLSVLAEMSMYSTKSQPDTNIVISPQSILI